MKYYIKRMDCITYGVYKSCIIKVCSDIDVAFQLAYELSNETGIKHFVDFE